MKKVLVTGGLGFIGSNLVHRLEHDPEITSITVIDRGVRMQLPSKKVRYIQADISVFMQMNTRQIKDAFRNVDTVFHLAAGITRVGDEVGESVVEQNIQGTMNVLRLCKNAGTRLVFASTGEVQAGLYEDPLENNNRKVVGVPDITDKRWGYAASKIACEAILFNSDYRNWTILRISNPYGPGQKGGVIATFIKQAYENGMIQVDKPRDTRSFVYIDDVVENLLSCAEGNMQIMYSGTTEEIQIQTLAFLIADRMLLKGYPVDVNIKENVKEKSERRNLPTTYMNKWSIVDGLRVTIGLFLSEQSENTYGTEGEISAKQQERNKPKSSRARKSKK